MQRFDVHAHAIWPQAGSDGMAAARRLMEHEGFVGTVPGAGWSVAAALTFMDERGIDLQLLSMPGALDADDARAWNDRTAQVVNEHPDRFGLLAALPMAEPDRAVEEIAHGVDDLHVDGFAVASNYGGRYLGDEGFEPVLAELDRHGLALLVHPSAPPGFDRLGLGRPGPLVEYPMDTARTAVDMVFAGVLLRHPRLPVVLAHGGGVLPTLHDRILSLGTEPWTANPRGLTREQLGNQLRALHLDTAIAGGAATIAPALAMVGADRLVFGTDYPPAGVATIVETVELLRSTLTPAQAERLEATFARLFPHAARRARR